MNPEANLQAVQAFAGALKGLRLYPVNHPAIERQSQQLLTSLAILFGRGEVRFGLLEGTLFVNDQLLADDSPAAQEVARQFEQLAVVGLEFHPKLREEELRILLELLKEGRFRGEDLGTALTDKGATNITLLKQESEDEEEEEGKSPREVYDRALGVVDSIFHDVRLGNIPSSTEANRVVKDMVQITLSDPHALFALSMLKDYDNYTFTHSVNVSVIALAVGRACGQNEERLRALGLGGLLHDLGKLIIDRGIITKPGRLTDAEFEEIKKHPDSGATIAMQMDGVTEDVVDIILGHHLRFNRSGYPDTLRAREMSLLADMTAIADTYDAMTTLRSYQRPMTPRQAIERLREIAGSALHPDFTERFIASLGPYPVGSLIRLQSNEIAAVVGVGIDDPEAVQLKIVFDAEGRRLPHPQPRSLEGAGTRQIVGEVDPFSRGITVTDYLD